MGTTTRRVGKDGKVSIQAKVRKHGVSHTGTFASQKLADAWITDMENRLNKGEATNFHDMRKITLGEIFTEYMKLPTLSEKKVANLSRLKIEIGAIRLGHFEIQRRRVPPLPFQADIAVDTLCRSSRRSDMPFPEHDGQDRHQCERDQQIFWANG